MMTAPMVPVLFRLGSITVYSFGAMTVLAFLLAGYVVSIELGRIGKDPDLAWPIVLWAALGGLVGARLFYIFYDLADFLDHPVGFLLTGSGFVWYGGLIGGFVSVTVLISRRRLPWLGTVDCIAPALALGQAIGRIGCQVSGDGDWGGSTAPPWGISYPQAVIGWHQWASRAGLPPMTCGCIPHPYTRRWPTRRFFFCSGSFVAGICQRAHSSGPPSCHRASLVSSRNASGWSR